MGAEEPGCVNDFEGGGRVVCWEDGEKVVCLGVRERGQGNKTLKGQGKQGFAGQAHNALLCSG